MPGTRTTGSGTLVPEPAVDLIVPVKSLTRAKSRLRGAADDGLGDPAAHSRLTLALARDTVAAAVAAEQVARVLVISSDAQVAEALARDGAVVLPEGPERGLNPALRRAARLVRHAGSAGPIGALQADLPALRPEELDAALADALMAFATGRAHHAYCADTFGIGTTLLVCAARTELRPRFGERSAAAHAATGAAPLDGPWPGLRRDVDTVEDLRHAAAIGIGPATRAALGTTGTLAPVRP